MLDLDLDSVSVRSRASINSESSIFSHFNNALDSPRSDNDVTFFPPETKSSIKKSVEFNLENNKVFPKRLRFEDEVQKPPKTESRRNSFSFFFKRHNQISVPEPVQTQRNRTSNTSNNSSTSTSSGSTVASFRTLKVRDPQCLKVKIDMGIAYMSLKLRKDKLVDLNDFLNVLNLKITTPFSKVFIMFQNNKLNALEINPLLCDIVFDYILVKDKILVRVE